MNLSVWYRDDREREREKNKKDEAVGVDTSSSSRKAFERRGRAWGDVWNDEGAKNMSEMESDEVWRSI
jgi:hypothetical protein